LASLSDVKPKTGVGDEERLLVLGLVGGLSLLFPLVTLPPTPNKLREIGVAAPEPDEPAALGRRSASDAARKRRLVVPSAFVEPERAEQTIATLCSSM